MRTWGNYTSILRNRIWIFAHLWWYEDRYGSWAEITKCTSQADEWLRSFPHHLWWSSCPRTTTTFLSPNICLLSGTSMSCHRNFGSEIFGPPGQHFWWKIGPPGPRNMVCLCENQSRLKGCILDPSRNKFTNLQEVSLGHLYMPHWYARKFQNEIKCSH